MVGRVPAAPPGLRRGLASRGTAPPLPQAVPGALQLPCGRAKASGCPRAPSRPGEVPRTERAGGRAEEWAPWGFAARQETPAAQAALGGRGTEERDAQARCQNVHLGKPQATAKPALRIDGDKNPPSFLRINYAESAALGGWG